MQLLKRLSLVHALAWVCLVLTSIPVNAHQDPLRVLILNSYDETSAPYYRPIDVFKKQLQQKHTERIAFQHVDLRQRISDNQGETDQSIAQLLLSRYAGSPPHLVVAAGPPAIDFWIQQRDTTFPDALFVAMARESYLRQARLKPTDAVVATQFSVKGTIENILNLLPQTSHIVMVFGDSISERVLSNEIRKALTSYSNRFELEFTNDMSMPEIQDSLADLSDDSAVFFGIFSKDVNGVSLQHHSGLEMVKAASRVPIFGAFDDQIGHGIVGGRLIQVSTIGIKIADAAQKLLDGNNPGDWSIVELSSPVYDWRELQAWNIDPDRLPPGSAVRFKPPGFWTQYADWVIGISFIVVAQSLLLSTLLIQRRKRRKAERAHASLGRRLITAHEDERRLIARELHDDLSQRLAGVAINAGLARSNSGLGGVSKPLDQVHRELVSISKDVHDMSYRLHPSLVDDLGVVAALCSEIERLQRQTDVPIGSKFDEITRRLSSDKALCVFRIAQEAMQNAVKYAQAKEIEITLKQASEELILTVQDNGVGFDLERTGSHFGLGLVSMQERATLVKGKLSINSRSGKGTTVVFTLPLGEKSK